MPLSTRPLKVFLVCEFMYDTTPKIDNSSILLDCTGSSVGRLDWISIDSHTPPRATRMPAHCSNGIAINSNNMVT